MGFWGCLKKDLESSVRTSYRRLNIQNCFYPVVCSQLNVLEMLHCKLSRLNIETLSLLLISFLIIDGQKFMWLLINMASSQYTVVQSEACIFAILTIQESTQVVHILISDFCKPFQVFSSVVPLYLLWQRLHFSHYWGAWIFSPVIWKSPKLKCSSLHYSPQNILSPQFFRT